MAKNIIRIPADQELAHYERVGIYCRVSSASGAQLHSLAAQASYLTKYVMRRSGWLLTDIYLDVESGSSTEQRSEYNRMLNDVRRGAISIIVVKSISRFGRNVESILSATREITAAGGSVYFDEQEISTKSPNSEMYISMYGSIAQAENQNLSENIRWSIRKRVADGSSAIFDRTCYGYRTDENGEFEIIEEEAAIVRKIYHLYIDGYSIVKIKNALETEEILSPMGKPTWSKNTIERILSNNKYCGGSEVWKSYSAGNGKTKRIANTGGHDRVTMFDHHDAIIIPKEMFDRVQDERSARSNVEIGEDGQPHRKSMRYTASKKEIPQSD